MIPVAGYVNQPDFKVDEVNGLKEMEERVLRVLDRLARADASAIDHRFLAIGRTQLQQAFMAINRSIFQPQRIELPEDEA